MKGHQSIIDLSKIPNTHYSYLRLMETLVMDIDDLLMTRRNKPLKFQEI